MTWDKTRSCLCCYVGCSGQFRVEFDEASGLLAFRERRTFVRSLGIDMRLSKRLGGRLDVFQGLR